MSFRGQEGIVNAVIQLSAGDGNRVARLQGEHKTTVTGGSSDFHHSVIGDKFIDDLSKVFSFYSMHESDSLHI